MKSKSNTKITDCLVVNTLSILESNMKNQKEWIKVHAAEFMLWSGYPDGVKELFIREEQLYGDISPYRIGIWRVLMQTETELQQKEVWIDKLRQAYFDKNSTDRLHAIETLAKLEVPVFGDETKLSDIFTGGIPDSFSIYKLWNFAYTSDENFEIVQELLLRFSVSEQYDFSTRSISLYALRKLGILKDSSWKILSDSTLSESNKNPIKVNLLTTAIITANNNAIQTDSYKEIWDNLLSLSRNEEKNNVCMNVLEAFAEKGGRDELEIISALIDKKKGLDDPQSVDVLSYCAFAILRIKHIESF
ncbi:hypothetical protein [uncultured Proteiniphilum sp.]|uniref:hypothetical protein n=1 Tax=uncultured Proteiniphilum sp. TaxID=497637 RepID=UPI002623EF9C|nr:hypothetical protein [uncultured Proteiniphilum sp.]